MWPSTNSSTANTVSFLTVANKRFILFWVYLRADESTGGVKRNLRPCGRQCVKLNRNSLAPMHRYTIGRAEHTFSHYGLRFDCQTTTGYRFSARGDASRRTSSIKSRYLFCADTALLGFKTFSHLRRAHEGYLKTAIGNPLFARVRTRLVADAPNQFFFRSQFTHQGMRFGCRTTTGYEGHVSCR